MKRAEEGVPSCCAWLLWLLSMIGLIILALTIHFGRAWAHDCDRYKSPMKPDVPPASRWHVFHDVQPGGS